MNRIEIMKIMKIMKIIKKERKIKTMNVMKIIKNVKIQYSLDVFFSSCQLTRTVQDHRLASPHLAPSKAIH